MLLSGRRLSRTIQRAIKKEVDNYKNKPGLGIILVGDNPDSKVYVNSKRKACQKAGFNCDLVQLHKTCDTDTIIDEINLMNSASHIHGIMMQLPLPDHLDETHILEHIIPEKDVDCFNSLNIGNLSLNKPNHLQSCTPKGIICLLDHYNIDIHGKNITVIGASKIVGLPLSMMLLNRGATVSICHIDTQDYREYTRNSDIVIVATGNPHLIKKDDLNKDRNTYIIDVGINKLHDGKLVGDVDFDNVKSVVKGITPVPGGVGPMTIAMVLENTLELYTKQSNL